MFHSNASKGKQLDVVFCEAVGKEIKTGSMKAVVSISRKSASVYTHIEARIGKTVQVPGEQNVVVHKSG